MTLLPLEPKPQPSQHQNQLMDIVPLSKFTLFYETPLREMLQY